MSIQDTVVYILQQHLSKQYTLQKWSIGLVNRLQHHDPTFSLNHHTNLIAYAVYDYLLPAQIVLFMYQSNIPRTLTCIQYFPNSDEHQLIHGKNVSDFFL